VIAIPRDLLTRQWISDVVVVVVVVVVYTLIHGDVVILYGWLVLLFHVI